MAGAPGVLPPVPFPAGSAAHASGSKLCSPGFSSPGLSPDREPRERANVNIPQGKVSYQPSLEVCVHIIGIALMGSSPWPSAPCMFPKWARYTGKCLEASLCSPLNTCFSLRSRDGATSHLNFAFPGIYSTGKFQPLYPFTWTITSNNVRNISLNAKPSCSRKGGGCGLCSKEGGGHCVPQPPKVGGAGGCKSFLVTEVCLCGTGGN